MKEISVASAFRLSSPNPLVLVCTNKADGRPNLAPVSFMMYASFHPPMLAFAMGKAKNSGENLRRTGKAVLAAPGVSLREAAMAYGKMSGSSTDKLAAHPIALQRLPESDISIPEDTRVAFLVSLAQTVEAGDHYLYLCSIDKIYGDETTPALLAWEGYAKLAPAQEG